MTKKLLLGKIESVRFQLADGSFEMRYLVPVRCANSSGWDRFITVEEAARMVAAGEAVRS